MAINGAQSRQLLTEAIEALAAMIPADVTIKVEGSGNWCGLTGSMPVDEDVVAKAFETKTSFRVPFTTWRSRGLGTWIPFVPRQLAARLAVVSAVESVQDLVAELLGKPWPAAGLVPKAEQTADGFRVWLASDAGDPVPLGIIGRDLLR